ncbi:unnamed protein product, partial [Phaeothamnion confervicola]
VQGHTEEITVLLSSADGRVISASFDSTLREWDPASGRCLGVYEGHSGCVNGFALHRDGRCIVSGSSDGSIKVWDRATRRCIKTLIAHPRQVRDNAETAAAAAVAAADDNAPGFVFAVALSPDGSRLFSGSGLRAQTDLELHAELKVWDFVTGKLRRIRTLSDHGLMVTCLAFSPDERRLASGSLDRTVKVWDVA